MKRGLSRTTAIGALFIFATILFVKFLYRTQNSNVKEKDDFELIRQQQQKQRPIEATPDEKFMSFFPHGDFATQHEAVRNALRIALETNRTLILPQLRLGKTSAKWLPFLTLAKYYESQDKDILKTLCKQKQVHWRTQYQPCQDVNEWIEMMWSDFFDLNALRDQFNLRIHERTMGHQWGLQDSLISQLGLEQKDIIVVDPTSFPSNGSDWENIDQLKQQQQQPIKSSFMDRFFSINTADDGLTLEERNSLKLTSALKNIVNAEHLMQLDQRYIQFGSLVYGLRFQTSTSEQQTALQKALRSNVFVSPNQLHATNQVSQNIINTLGESFSVIHMSFEKLALIELNNQRVMKKEKAEIEGKKFTDDTKTVHPDGRSFSALELIQQLDSEAQTELMKAIVREFNGDMPINQALSAALPLQESLLKDMVVESKTLPRRDLLSACIDYKQQVNNKYPIYYLTNDVYQDIVQHPELFKPLLDYFPCIFTKNDMYQWNIVDPHWATHIDTLDDKNVDYEEILSPMVEILVARKGYSFFEVPTTKLTRLLSWH